MKSLRKSLKLTMAAMRMMLRYLLLETVLEAPGISNADMFLLKWDEERGTIE